MSMTWAERWRAWKEVLSLGALAVPLPDPWPCGRHQLVLHCFFLTPPKVSPRNNVIIINNPKVLRKIRVPRLESHRELSRLAFDACGKCGSKCMRASHFVKRNVSHRHGPNQEVSVSP